LYKRLVIEIHFIGEVILLVITLQAK